VGEKDSCRERRAGDRGKGITRERERGREGEEERREARGVPYGGGDVGEEGGPIPTEEVREGGIEGGREGEFGVEIGRLYDDLPIPFSPSSLLSSLPPSLPPSFRNWKRSCRNADKN